MTRHAVRNFGSLAATPLRRDALAVLEAGLRAIDTRGAVRGACTREGTRFRVGRKTFDLSRFDRVYVVGIGKAACDAGSALEDILGRRIDGGIVLDVKARKLERMTSIAGTHPFPSERNLRATARIIELLGRAGPKDLVIAVVSGGGSALLCRPYRMKCDSLALITRTLMARGADIREVNTVRKHLSEVQGGQLVALAGGATILGLLFSDVPGDDPGTIASGPTVLDTTTADDAAEVLARYGVLQACRMPDCELTETPKDPALFRKVTNVMLMTNAVALDAMREEAARRGYRVRVVSRTVSGEAREVGAALAARPKPGEMLLAGGETTVTVRAGGKGGRNQEAALGALAAVPDDGLLLACASDGIDNTPAAGAIADGLARRRAAEAGLDPAAALAKNASYDFFGAAGSRIVTGKTGANVSDLLLAARAKRPRRT